MKRGTNVKFNIVTSLYENKFTEAWKQNQITHYYDNYGLTVGDKGTVVRSKNGWIRVSWTLVDGKRVTSVPMRADHLSVIASAKTSDVMEIAPADDDTALQSKLDDAGYARVLCDLSVENSTFKKARIEREYVRKEELVSIEMRLAKLEEQMARLTVGNYVWVNKDDTTA